MDNTTSFARATNRTYRQLTQKVLNITNDNRGLTPHVKARLDAAVTCIENDAFPHRIASVADYATTDLLSILADDLKCEANRMMEKSQELAAIANEWKIVRVLEITTEFDDSPRPNDAVLQQVQGRLNELLKKEVKCTDSSAALIIRSRMAELIPIRDMLRAANASATANANAEVN